MPSGEDADFGGADAVDFPGLGGKELATGNSGSFGEVGSGR